ncbi:MAG: HupE/UreJ family protein [Pseudomonadota bacterium]
MTGRILNRRPSTTKSPPYQMHRPPIEHSRLSSPLSLLKLRARALTALWNVILVAFATMLAFPAQAHELPERVAIKLIIQSNENNIDLMLRAPLESMRDVDFPLTPEGYLILGDAQGYLEEAAGLWLVDNLRLREGSVELEPELVTVRAALPGDRAFASADAAQTHFAGPALADSTQIFWRQVMLDVRLRYEPGSRASLESMYLDTSLRALGVATRIELTLAESSGESRDFSFSGDVRNLALQPTAWIIAANFMKQGFIHILGGIDHLLFLLCLILPIREMWPLVKAVTAFTAAHSVTLVASALGWIPSPLWFANAIEVLIALSIFLLAVENILRQQTPKRWIPAFSFGLIHGFGFASALDGSLQFAQGQLLVALASFNVGVELGQLAVLGVGLSLLFLLLRHVPSERVAVIVLSTLVAHTAWHWMSERAGMLWGYF